MEDTWQCNSSLTQVWYFTKHNVCATCIVKVIIMQVCLTHSQFCCCIKGKLLHCVLCATLPHGLKFLQDVSYTYMRRESHTMIQRQLRTTAQAWERHAFLTFLLVANMVLTLLLVIIMIIWRTAHLSLKRQQSTFHQLILVSHNDNKCVIILVSVFSFQLVLLLLKVTILF